MGLRILRFTLQILKTCMQSINIFSRATSKFFNLFLKEPKEHPLQTLKICVAKHLEFLAHRPYPQAEGLGGGLGGPSPPVGAPQGNFFFKTAFFPIFQLRAARAARALRFEINFGKKGETKNQACESRQTIQNTIPSVPCFKIDQN